MNAYATSWQQVVVMEFGKRHTYTTDTTDFFRAIAPSRGELPVQRYTGFRTPVRGQFSDGTLTEYWYRYRYEYCLLTLTLTLASFTFIFFSPSPYSFCKSRTLRRDLKWQFSKYSTVISFKLNFGNLHTSSIRVHHYSLSSLIDRGHY